MDRTKTIQMRMTPDWLDIAKDEAELAFGGNRSEMVRVSVLALRKIREDEPAKYFELVSSARAQSEEKVPA